MKPKSKKLILSIVIPLYNEAIIIAPLVTALNTSISKLSVPTEVIFVNDGSTDATEELLTKAKLSSKKTILTFSRNFGHQSALLAGLEQAQGEFVVTMDGDLQHPVALIPKMLALHNKGIDIVLTRRIDLHRPDLLKRYTSSLFYSVLNLMSDRKITENSSDFRSMNRRSLNQLLALPEKRKFLRGMVEWLGYSQYVIPYKVKSRAGGQSKYSLRKMVNLAITGVTSYSTSPLYVSALFGVVLFISAACYSLYVIIVKLVFDQAVQGWASVLLVLLVIGGFISLFLGIIGLYIAAIYDEIKSRPIYIISKVIK